MAAKQAFGFDWLPVNKWHLIRNPAIRLEKT
jgi:hypothetical protein